MKQSGDHKSYLQQKAFLELKGIKVGDLTIMKKVNITHLVHKYGHLYKTPNEKTQYKKNTSLTHIYNLFLFNNQLEGVLFEFLIRFEHQIKAVAAYHIGEQDPYMHTSVKKFSLKHSSKAEARRFMHGLKKINKRLRESSPDRFIPKAVIPIWNFINQMSFGQVRMLLKLSTVQDLVLNDLGLQSSQWRDLILINHYRNLVFHAKPLVPNILRSDTSYKLMDLMGLIKNYSPDVLKKMALVINQKNFEKELNLNKLDVLNFLQISSFFNT